MADEERPSAACIIVEHLQLDAAPEAVAAELEVGYEATAWEVGAQ